jgi:hypothetical protein
MLGMAATVFEPATYNATTMMDVDYGTDANATGSTTTIANNNNKKRGSSSLMVAGSESAPSFMTCDFYSNKKAAALFTRPSSINQLDDDTLETEAEDMMEMADLAYFTTGAFTDRACFDDMPEELVYLIFTFLHGSDIANGVQKVCRNWRRLALDDPVCFSPIHFFFPLLLLWSIYVPHLHL